MASAALFGTDQAYRDQLVDSICNTPWTGMSQHKLDEANNHITELQSQVRNLTAQLETAHQQQQELRMLHQCLLLPKREQPLAMPVIGQPQHNEPSEVAEPQLGTPAELMQSLIRKIQKASQAQRAVPSGENGRWRSKLV